MRHLVILAFFTTLFSMAGEDGPFEKMGYGKALKKAEEEQKLIFIDFYTTWCGPCKMLDAQTWKDPAVIAWLRENTVAIKVDAERNRGLARKYQVNSYPTLMFLDTEGTVMHRMSGFRPAKRFLYEAGWFERDPFKRLKLGQELAKQGQNDQALSAWLWCLDYGTTVNPEFAQTRDQLYDHLLKMAENEKSVRKAMKSRTK